MKLSKLTLEWLIYHAQHSDAAGYTDLKIIDEIDEALDNNTLEIEGYVRKDQFRDAAKMVDEWTKFDSCKGNTYPPKEKFLAWGLPDPDCDGTPTEFFCWRDDGDFSCNESAYPEIHFWRPLPKPPVESEK